MVYRGVCVLVVVIVSYCSLPHSVEITVQSHQAEALH